MCVCVRGKQTLIIHICSDYSHLGDNNSDLHYNQSSIFSTVTINNPYHSSLDKELVVTDGLEEIQRFLQSVL